MRRRGASGPGDMVDVDLGDGTDGARRPERARRRLRLIGAAVAAALVLVAVAANVLELRADRARAERLAGVPGVVAPFGDPLEEAWRVTGALVLEIGEVLVVDGPEGMRGVDAVSGETLWALDPAERVGRHVAPCTGAPRLQAGPAAEESHLLCLTPLLLDGLRPGTPVEVEVLDAATGSRLAVLADEGSYLGTEWVDGDVVLLVAAPGGQLSASRWDPRTGERRWATTTSAPVFTPSVPNPGWGWTDGAIVVPGDLATVAIDLGSGAEVPAGDATVESDRAVLELADGATAVVSWGSTGSSTRVLDPDGEERFEVPGVALEAQVDDGSAARLLLVRDDDFQVHGLDVRTGERRWSTPVEGAWVPNVLSGTVLVAGFTETVALDAATGEELWRAPVGGMGGVGLVSDGERVLVLEERDAAAHLVARGLRDGGVVWERPLPERAWGVWTSGGRVLLSAQDAVAGLG